MKKTIAVVVLMGFLLSFDNESGFGQQEIVFTDADGSARIVCRNDQTAEACFMPRAGGDGVIPDPFVDNSAYYIRVHDQNAVMSGYWHFDLGDIDSNAEVLDARFQLDMQSNSWSDITTVSVFAIADPAKDWDLNQLPENEIIGANAPQSDWDSFAWTGDPNNPQRFNSPVPFLEEGDLPSSTVRLLEEFIDIDGTDSITTGDAGDPGNEYGGVAGADGPGTGGSSDGGINPWPVKNVVDIDVTELIQWKMGQNPAFSDFDPVDRELTLLVRTDSPAAGENGFVRFIAKESPFLGDFGPLDLQPGRLVLDLGVTVPACDFDDNGVCDIADLDGLLFDGQAQQILDPYDLNADGTVDLADRDEWYTLASAENGVVLVPGDTNLDGRVVASDLNDLGSNWLRSDATTIAQGDFNGDGLVGAGDLNDIGVNWLHGVAAAAIPEPYSLALLVWTAIGVLAVYRRRKW